jgi:hypothetical protein
VKILDFLDNNQYYRHSVWFNDLECKDSGYIASDDINEVIKYLHLTKKRFHHYYQYGKVIISCTGAICNEYKVVAREDFITELLKYTDKTKC